MPSRREVMIAGLAGGALAAAPGLLRAASGARADGAMSGDTLAAAPYRIIVDGRFAAARALAQAAQERGWTVRLISGDVTTVWYEELALRWRTGPAPIAGLTTASALFCLERLAWDAGMRLNLRIEHRGHRDGRVEHGVTAQPGLLARRDLPGLARVDFAAALPPLLARATHASRGRAEQYSLAGAPAAAAVLRHESLVSWSIGTRAPATA